MNLEKVKGEIPHRLMQIAERIRAAGGKCFLVGGFVRDAMLGKASRDFDVEVYDIGQDALLKILSDFGRPNLVGKAFGVVHLASKGLDLDFSFPRTENKVGEGHRGFLVETHLHLSFAEAALRRDFTVNAMGLSLPELELSDPYDGKGDLERHLLRHVSSAFAEDSLRVLRGVQFASRFSLSLAPETAALCRSLSLADLSSERIFEEFRKWLLKPGRPSFGLRAFIEMELSRFFPEIRPLGGSFENLGILLDNVSRKLPTVKDPVSKEVLAFAALLSGTSDISEVNGFLSRITNEAKLLKRVPELCRMIPLFVAKAKSGPFEPEFLRRASVDLDGLELVRAYLESTPELAENLRIQSAEALSLSAQRLGVFECAPKPFLKGADLLLMGLRPGRRIGEIIREEFELQLQGKILSRDAALLFARNAISSETA